MDGSFPFYFPIDVLTSPFTLIGIAFILFGAITVPLTVRRMLRRGEIADLYALIIDKQHRKIYRIPMVKLADRIYGATKDMMLFLFMPSRSVSYTCWFSSKVPCVLAYKRNYIALPIDPAFVSALSALMRTEELADIPKDELSKIISHLYSMQEKLIGHIKISPSLEIAMAFDVEKMLTEYFDKVMDDACEAIQHFFAMSRNYQTFQKYVESMQKFVTAKYAWMRWLIPLLITIGIVWILVNATFSW